MKSWIIIIKISNPWIMFKDERRVRIVNFNGWIRNSNVLACCCHFLENVITTVIHIYGEYVIIQCSSITFVSICKWFVYHSMGANSGEVVFFLIQRFLSKNSISFQIIAANVMNQFIFFVSVCVLLPQLDSRLADKVFSNE